MHLSDFSDSTSIDIVLKLTLLLFVFGEFAYYAVVAEKLSLTVRIQKFEIAAVIHSIKSLQA